MSCFYTIHVYSKQRNSDGSREAEEQEEHMLLDTGKVVRKNLFSTPRRLTVGPWQSLTVTISVLNGIETLRLSAANVSLITERYSSLPRYVYKL